MEKYEVWAGNLMDPRYFLYKGEGREVYVACLPDVLGNYCGPVVLYISPVVNDEPEDEDI